MILITYLGFPFTTSTVTATPLSSKSTQGPAFSIQTSITLISSCFSLLKVLLAPKSWFSDFCQLTVFHSDRVILQYRPAVTTVQTDLCVQSAAKVPHDPKPVTKLHFRMDSGLCCLQFSSLMRLFMKTNF